MFNTIKKYGSESFKLIAWGLKKLWHENAQNIGVFFCLQSYLRNGLTDFNETWYKCLILQWHMALQVLSRLLED